MKPSLYARVSTPEPQTLALQQDAMTAYAQQRQGGMVLTVEAVGSEVSERRQREVIMRAARLREIDAMVVWRVDRGADPEWTWWARSASCRRWT